MTGDSGEPLQSPLTSSGDRPDRRPLSPTRGLQDSRLPPQPVPEESTVLPRASGVLPRGPTGLRPASPSPIVHTFVSQGSPTPSHRRKACELLGRGEGATVERAGSRGTEQRSSRLRDTLENPRSTPLRPLIPPVRPDSGVSSSRRSRRVAGPTNPGPRVPRPLRYRRWWRRGSRRRP